MGELGAVAINLSQNNGRVITRKCVIVVNNMLIFTHQEKLLGTSHYAATTSTEGRKRLGWMWGCWFGCGKSVCGVGGEGGSGRSNRFCSIVRLEVLSVTKSHSGSHTHKPSAFHS